MEAAKPEQSSLDLCKRTQGNEQVRMLQAGQRYLAGVFPHSSHNSRVELGD